MVLPGHNITCGTHHKRMATWFIESSILVNQTHAFRESKEASLFCIYGKRAPVSLSPDALQSHLEIVAGSGKEYPLFRRSSAPTILVY